MPECNLCGPNDDFQPAQVKSLITTINASEQKPQVLNLFHWISATHGLRLQNFNSIDHLFSGDDAKEAAVPHVDVAQIIAIAQLACKLIGFLNDAVCPIVSKL